MRAKLSQPVFVALDVDTAEKAIELVQQTQGLVGGYKIGPRLCMRYGAELIERVARSGQVFVDNKYFDIPSTMEAAVRATFAAGASFCTIHAQAGAEALKRLAEVEDELCQQRPFRLLAVTVLTSFDQSGLPSVSRSMPIAQQVQELADLTLNCGLSGVVCSPEEVEALRKKLPQAYLVTPGVRLSDDSKQDQKRVADPGTALKRGASALVVGRPIIESTDPKAVARRYYEEIQKI